MKTTWLLMIVLSVSLISSSCGAKKKVKSKSPSRKTIKKNTEKTKSANNEVFPKTKDVSIVTSKKDISTETYIKKYATIAQNQMKIHQIPASITLAQGILESRSGNSDLTSASNNHFGIKCHKGWTGAMIHYDDDKKDECFRAYDYPAQSFEDHSQFLVKRKRYAKLFKLKKGDYKAWAKGLKKAGYATDKKYPKKLIRIIEKYELYKYDEQVLEKRVSADPNIYIVQKGDGLYGIARRNNIKISELMDINNLTTSNIYPGQELYLKRTSKQTTDTHKITAVVSAPIPTSKTKVESVPEKQTKEVKTTIATTPIQEPEQKKPTYHIVEKGETLYQIAYKYKLAVPDLRRWNGVRKNEIRVGQRVFITDPATSGSVDTNANSHIVIPEDTLYSIAKKYHTSVSEIMRLNNLKNYTIYIGQVLVVK